MTYFRRLEGFTPPERQTVHWVSARIEEAPTPTDAAAVGLATIALSPAITDPMSPPTYDFETTLATLAAGWYRVVWIDANADEQPTEWVERRLSSPYAPTVGDIATVLRARTVGLGGVRVGTFTDQTTPTAEEVQQMIELYAPLVLMRFGRLDDLHCANSSDLLAGARAAVAARVAIEVETSYWPEEVGDSASAAIDNRRAALDTDVTSLHDMLEECRASSDDGGDGGDSTSRSDPAWLFPPMYQLRY